jgi:hypothetical protein
MEQTYIPETTPTFVIIGFQEVFSKNITGYIHAKGCISNNTQKVI